MAVTARRSRLNTHALEKLRQGWLEDRLKVSRRLFVKGSAAALAVPAFAKAAAGAASLGGFKMQSFKNSSGKIVKVSLQINGGEEWVLDASLLEGNPKLKVLKKDKTVSIDLTDARLPGTKFNLNLSAKITPKVMGHEIEIRFFDTGVKPQEFTMKGPFEQWVAGTSDLCAKLQSEALSDMFGGAEFTDHVGVRHVENGTVRYEPSGKLRVDGEAVLTTPDAEYTVKGVEVSVQPRTPETLVGGTTTAATVLGATRSGDWAHAVNAESQSGWSLTGTTSGFDSITSEHHETGAAGIVLTGSGGISATLGDGFSLPADEVQFSQLHGPSTDTIFSAKLKDEPVWFHQPGISAQIAPQPDTTMMLRTDRDGVLAGAPALEARKIAPVIDDAIVTVKSDADAYPVELQVRQQKEILQKPILQKAIITPPQAQATTISERPVSLYLIFFPTFEIVRAADMLNLTFELVNVSFSTSGTGSTFQVSDPNSPGYIVVIFPPQSLTEDTFSEVVVPPGIEPLPGPASSLLPVKTRLANPTRLVFAIPRTGSINLTLEGPGGLLDWSTWSPMVAPTAMYSYAREWNVVINPAWAGAVTMATASDTISVLSANTTPVPKKILSRSNSIARVALGNNTANATPSPVVAQLAKNINPAKIVAMVPTGRMPVSYYQTWIEIPAWSAISPPETAQWIHSPAPTPGAPNPLWNTRLAYGTSTSPLWSTDDGKWFYVPSPTGFSGPFQSTVELHPTIRMVDAWDYSKNPGTTDWFNLPTMSQSQRCSLVDGMTPRSLDSRTDTPAFQVGNLMLTALGGFLKGEWNYPNAPVKQGVIGWKHLATLGRDHYVRITQRGFIYPFMHKAVLVQISERKFNRDPQTGAMYAVLRQRIFIMVTQPTVVYDADTTRKLGFQQITCLTKTTPNLDPNSKNPHNDVNTPNIFWMTQVGQPVLLSMRGTDIDGIPISWDQECGFVDLNSGVTQGSQSTVLALGDPPGPPSDFGGQVVTFAPVDPTKPPNPDPLQNHPQTTHFPCLSIVFDGAGGNTDGRNIPNFRPTLKQASIRNAAIETMQTGAGNTTPAGPLSVKFADIYRTAGFGASNGPETLFEVISSSKAVFNNLTTSGGIVNPDMPIGAISRKIGSIPSVPAGDGSVALSNYIGQASDQLAAKILGAVSIWSLVPDPINLGGDGKDAPKITITKVFSLATGPDPSLQSAAGSVAGILGTSAPNIPPTKQVIGAMVQFLWTPALHNWYLGVSAKGDGPPDSNALFVAEHVDKVFTQDKTKNYGGQTPPTNATFTINASFQEIITQGTSPKDPAPGSHYNLKAELAWFRINAIAGALSVIFVDVQRIGFYASDGTNPQIKIDIPAITFTGPLSFVQTLENWLGGGSNAVHFPSDSSSTPGSSNSGSDLLVWNHPVLDDGSAGPGFTPILNVTDSAIEVGGTLTIPDISVGMFSLSNISFTATINLPFLGPSFTITFSFCTKDKPFLLSVDGIAGGGFFAISLAPSGIQEIQASLEFGASISIDLGVASGGVSIMAGIYYDYEAASSTTTLTGFVKLQGNLTVIEIISMSLEFYLSLTWQMIKGVSSVTGTATMTVEVSILFFSVGVSISVTKTFGGSASASIDGNDPYALVAELGGGALAPAPGSTPYTQGVSSPQWNYYCASFATIS